MFLPEKLLIQELKGGNAAAFEALYDRYHARLYNFCLKIIRNTQEAEDLVQEVFIVIWENREILDENKLFQSFVFRIAKNKVLNKIKKNLSRQVYMEYIQKENRKQDDLRNNVEYHELMNFLQKSIQQLPEKTKNIFILSRNEGFTYKEIAHKLDISKNVVDHEIRKSLQYIKDQLNKFYSTRILPLM